MSIQYNIKNDCQELKDVLSDMVHWEKNIKEDDSNLRKKQEIKTTGLEKEKMPPVRSNLSAQSNNELNNVQKNLNKEVNNVQENLNKEAKPKPISAYDYAAWDKYVANEASHSDSSDDEKNENDDDYDNIASKLPILNNMEKAKKFKEEGNGCYSNGKLTDAVDKYTHGIALDPQNNLLYANRAMAYIKLNNFKAAELDCSKCLEIDPRYIKAYLRRATSRYHLMNFSSAIDDYKKVLELEPWNKDAKRELERVQILQHKNKSMEAQNQLNSTKKEATNKLLLDSENVQDETLSNDLKLPFPSSNIVRDLPKRKQKNNPISKQLCDTSPVIKLLEPTKPKEVPVTPRNSRQFELDWRKVSRYPDLAQSYLESIPQKFFDGVEVDVDLLTEIVYHLKIEDIDSNFAFSLFQSLTKTGGFYLNLSFLEPTQKQDFRKFLEVLEEKGKTNDVTRGVLNFLKV